jgi:acyl-CoA thioester hydrolase
MNREVATSFRVRYAETDAWGIVYHANYIIYFEIGRGELNRAMNLDWHAVEATGQSMLVAEAHVRYLAPARYDDLLTVYTRIAELRTRSLRFEYRVMRGEQPIATGWTAHVMVDREGRAVPLSPLFLDAVQGMGLYEGPETSTRPGQT